jgi:hypothetical protein
VLRVGVACGCCVWVFVPCGCRVWVLRVGVACGRSFHVGVACGCRVWVSRVGVRSMWVSRVGVACGCSFHVGVACGCCVLVFVPCGCCVWVGVVSRSSGGPVDGVLGLGAGDRPRPAPSGARARPVVVEPFAPASYRDDPKDSRTRKLRAMQVRCPLQWCASLGLRAALACCGALLLRQLTEQSSAVGACEWVGTRGGPRRAASW